MNIRRQINNNNKTVLFFTKRSKLIKIEHEFTLMQEFDRRIDESSCLGFLQYI